MTGKINAAKVSSFSAVSLILSLSLTNGAFAQMPKSIIVGAVYNLFAEEFPTDRNYFEQVDKDMALMESCNINHVMIFPMGDWNPNTKQIDWTRTDYLVSKIGLAQMKFVPVLLKEEQCFEYFPIWKFREIPGMWDEYNKNDGGKNNRDNVDFADPRVYPVLEEYFREVIARYRENPALGFYNIWNEPHYSSTAPQVIDEFRNWLRMKYDSLSALQRSWGIEYDSWDEVSPFLTGNWKSSMPQIDWTLFRNELNGILLDKLLKTLRQYDSIHAVNANPVGTTWANFSPLGGYDIDNWAVSGRDDISGISYYPDQWERNHNLQPCPFWLHNLTFNTIRCAAGTKPYILTEFYTNQQNGLSLNGYLTKELASLLAWTALANNCKGIIYWKWQPFMRGRQSLGRGLIRADGTLAPSGEAVGEFGKVIKKYGETLYNAQLEKPKVAILLDIVGLIKTLEQTTEMATNKFMYESNAGLFKALYEGDISADVLRTDRRLTLEDLKSYKILFLPFQIVMRQDVAELLKEYVKQGGWVVADARTATVNELDFAYRISPGAGLDSLFGAVRTSWVADKGSSRVRVRRIGDEKPFTFEGKYFRESLRPVGNLKTLGTYEGTDEPALVMNWYGNGTAVLSAVPLGASYLDNPDNPIKELILYLVREAGAAPDAEFISKTNGFVDLKIHDLAEKRIVYLINSEDFLKTGRLEVNVGNLKVREVRDILSEKMCPFKQNGGKLSLPLAIPPNRAMVLFVE